MSTRAEQFHAEEQRKARQTNIRAKRSKPGVAPKDRTQAKPHAEKNAAYALEETAPGTRPSRKSTRKSANRSKPDTGFNLSEQAKKGSPEATYAKSKARAERVRGSNGSGSH